MDLIAVRNINYLGRALKVGDRFSPHPVLGKAYKASGYARDAGEVGEAEYETRVMVAAEPAKRKRGRPRKTEV